MRKLLNRLDEGQVASSIQNTIQKKSNPHGLEDNEDLSRITEPENTRGRKSPLSNIKEDLNSLWEELNNENVSITQHQKSKRYPKAEKTTGKKSIVGHEDLSEDYIPEPENLDDLLPTKVRGVMYYYDSDNDMYWDPETYSWYDYDEVFGYRKGMEESKKKNKKSKGFYSGAWDKAEDPKYTKYDPPNTSNIGKSARKGFVG